MFTSGGYHDYWVITINKLTENKTKIFIFLVIKFGRGYLFWQKTLIMFNLKYATIVIQINDFFSVWDINCVIQ